MRTLAGNLIVLQCGHYILPGRRIIANITTDRNGAADTKDELYMCVCDALENGADRIVTANESIQTRWSMFDADTGTQNNLSPLFCSNLYILEIKICK